MRAPSSTVQQADRLRGHTGRPPGAEQPDDRTREAFKPPQRVRDTLLLLPFLALVGPLWALGVLPSAIAVGFAGFQLTLLLVQAALGAFGLFRARRLGDAVLRADPNRPPISALAAWRADELTSPRYRRRLARLVRALRRETDACRPSPELRLSMLDETRSQLRRLEDRLGQLAEPVSPVGTLELHNLITSNISPLYFPERACTLPDALIGALAALDVR